MNKSKSKRSSAEKKLLAKKPLKIPKLFHSAIEMKLASSDIDYYKGVL